MAHVATPDGTHQESMCNWRQTNLPANWWDPSGCKRISSIAAQLLIQPGYPHMMELPSNAAADLIIPNVHNTH